MGRRSRSQQSADRSTIANEIDSLSLSVFNDGVLGVEDRRLHYPSRLRPAVGVTRSSTEVVVPNINNYDLGGFSFGDPSLVAICLRRQRRREVLHAYRRTGKGSGRNKKRRRTWHSSISCKR